MAEALNQQSPDWKTSGGFARPTSPAKCLTTREGLHVCASMANFIHSFLQILHDLIPETFEVPQTKYIRLL